MTTTTRTAVAVPDAPNSLIDQLRWTFVDAWTLTLRGINYWFASRSRSSLAGRS